MCGAKGSMVWGSRPVTLPRPAIVIPHPLTCRQALWVDIRLSVRRLLPFFGNSKVYQDLCVSVGGKRLGTLWMGQRHALDGQRGRGTGLQRGRGTLWMARRGKATDLTVTGAKAKKTPTCVLAPRPLASSQG